MNTIHYILKDHLGSWVTITDAEGKVEQELSFDAWGNLRDADTWTGASTEAPMFDRGYTGHEHLCAFGLINMNGRCYDPLMSSFLSVDAYVQDPSNAQGFNRYSYCLNNPLRYTDPSGWLYLGASHSQESELNRYRRYANASMTEEQWANRGIDRVILATIRLGVGLEMTPFMMGEERKGGGGGIVIKGRDGNQTRYSIGMKYDGKDEFTKKTVDYLNGFSEKSTTAARVLAELSKSEFAYTIVESEYNTYSPDNQEMYVNPNNDEFYVAGGGTIQFSLNGNFVYEKKLGIEVTSQLMCRPYMGLMHELSHAWDNMAGLLATDKMEYKGLKVSEWMAIRTENAIRTEVGRPLRTHYGINSINGVPSEPEWPPLYKRNKYQYKLYSH